MKRFFSLLYFLLLPLCYMAAYNYDFESDGKYYEILSMKDNTLRLTFGENKYKGNLIIPDQVEFRGKVFTVTHIGRHTILAALDTLRIPASVVEIDDDALYKDRYMSENQYCSHIKYLDIVDGDTDLHIGRVGNTGMFEGCKVDHLYAGRMLSYQCYPGMRKGLGEVTLGKNIVTLTNDFVPMTLKTYEIPSQITRLADYAFGDCSELTSIKGVERMGTIGKGTFSCCSSLQRITLPKHMGILRLKLFESCTSLKEIEIPEDVSVIEDYAFMGCNSLQRIKIPENVTSLSLRTFYGCAKLKEVELPSHLQSIGFQAFCFCHALEHIDIPATVNSIESEAFASCTLLRSVILPEGITRLPSRLFVACDSLKQCVIPNTVTSIEGGAFSGCISLSSITLPASVREIQDYAFSGCDQLKVIRMGSATPQRLYNKAFNKDQYLDSELQVPLGAKAAYQKADGWMNFWNITEYNASDALRLMVTGSANGRVVVGNDTISNKVYAKDYSAVEDVTVNFLPDEGYGVKRVTVNDEDMTNRLKDNCLTLRVDRILNVKVEFVHQLLVLDDAYDNYRSTTSEVLEKVIYRRQFDDTSWQALYLPFAMDYDDWSSVLDVACIHDTHQYDNNHDGKVDRTAIEAFLLMEGSSTQPNTPYLVRAKTEGTVTLEKQNVTLSPAFCQGFDCSSVTTCFTFTGTYSEREINDLWSDDYYALQHGVLVPIHHLSTLGGYRWWMQAQRRNHQQWTAPLKIEIDIVDNISGVTEILPMEENDRRRGADVYNLQGKLVKRGASNLDGLANGLYIIGGKKVVKGSRSFR